MSNRKLRVSTTIDQTGQLISYDAVGTVDSATGVATIVVRSHLTRSERRRVIAQVERELLTAFVEKRDETVLWILQPE